MPICDYRHCKHYSCGYCAKFDELVPMCHTYPFTRFHPLDYLTLYYNESQKYDISKLITLVEKHLTDYISKSICNYYRRKGYITRKQKRLLLHNIFHCSENDTTEESDYYFTQVED